jgi:hypothetical protein
MIRILLLIVLAVSCRTSTVKNSDQQKDLESWASAKFGGDIGLVMNSSKSHVLINKLMRGAGYQKQSLPFWVIRLSDKAQVAAGEFSQGQISWTSEFEISYLAPQSLQKVGVEPKLSIIDIRKIN